MSKFNEQYLFLLEFFVEFIRSPRLAKLNEMFFVPTTLQFEFLELEDPEFVIQPVDSAFRPILGVADEIESFASGRSVTFVLSHDLVRDKLQEFVIRAHVHKIMPDGIGPNIEVGESQLDFSPEFSALRKEFLSTRNPSCRLFKYFDGNVPLVHCGKQVGLVRTYVRLTALGQSVVTTIECPSDLKNSRTSFHFAGEACCGDRENLEYKFRALDSDGGSLASGNKCWACQVPKFPCAPCGVSSGAELGCTYAQEEGASQSAGCGKAVVLKVAGLVDCGTGEKVQPAVTVAPECEGLRPEDLRKDREFDVFVLRIGKKGLVGADDKCDLQIELKTPKGPDKRPPLRMETREIQTEEDKPKQRQSAMPSVGGSEKSRKNVKKMIA